MKIILNLCLTWLVLVLLAAQCSPSPAPQTIEPKISIVGPYAQPAAAAGNGVIYLTIKNEGGSPDTLLNVTSPAAAAAELHETQIDANDMAQMGQLTQVGIPAGASVSLEPGGKHIMLVKLKQELKVGDKIEVVLNFEKAGALTVEAGVQEGGQDSEHVMEHSE